MSDTEIEHDPSKLAELVKGIRTVMLTSPDAAGALHGRPLTVQQVDDDGTIWFLVNANAEWVSRETTKANVAFVDSDTWVSACGSVSLVDDEATIAELGDPVSGSWFDEDTPPAALRVSVDHADYWSAPGKLVQMVKMGKAAITQNAPDMGDRGVIEP